MCEANVRSARAHAVELQRAVYLGVVAALHLAVFVQHGANAQDEMLVRSGRVDHLDRVGSVVRTRDAGESPLELRFVAFERCLIGREEGAAALKFRIKGDDAVALVREGDGQGRVEFCGRLPRPRHQPPPPAAPVQGWLQGPPAKSKFLAVSK